LILFDSTGRGDSTRAAFANSANIDDEALLWAC
jgi:hypothetical protein